MTSSTTTLASLKRGEKAVVKRVHCADPAVQRLMVLGLVVGTELEHTGAAIGGDPLEFRFFNVNVSLRREQARCFEVAASPEP